MVLKLSGFAKFEVDLKMHSQQFFHFLELFASSEEESEVEVTLEPEEGEEEGRKEMQIVRSKVLSEERFEQITEVFGKAFKDNATPF